MSIWQPDNPGFQPSFQDPNEMLIEYILGTSSGDILSGGVQAGHTLITNVYGSDSGSISVGNSLSAHSLEQEFSYVWAAYDQTVGKYKEDNAQLWGTTGGEKDVSVVSDGEMAACQAGGVGVWNNDGSLKWSDLPTETTSAVELNSEKHCYVGFTNGEVRKYDSSGTEITADSWPLLFDGNGEGEIRDIRIAPSEKFIFLITEAAIYKIDATEGTEYTQDSWPMNDQIGVSYSLAPINDDDLYAGFDDGTVQHIVAGSPSSADSWPFSSHLSGSNVYGVTVDPSDNTNIFSCSDNGSIRKINTDGTEDTSGNWPYKTATTINDIRADFAGRIYSAHSDNTWRLIDTDGTELLVNSKPTGPVEAVDTTSFMETI